MESNTCCTPGYKLPETLRGRRNGATWQGRLWLGNLTKYVVKGFKYREEKSDYINMWSKASNIERKNLTISEVMRDEEVSYKIKVVSQGQQGRWTTWEAVRDRVLTCADLWRMPQARLIFLIRSMYDTPPSTQNLKLWYGAEESC